MGVAFGTVSNCMDVFIHDGRAIPLVLAAIPRLWAAVSILLLHTPENEMAGPLDGIRILDLTTVILRPYATQILGDMGADVIKVETPDGDSTRYTGPGRSGDMAALFMGVNRNKRSIVLDLKKPGGLEALNILISQADVLVHNMRPQKATKLGLSADRVLSRNPNIVFAGLYGYREGGAYSGRPAYDDVIQAQCGLAALMEGEEGRPRFAPTVIADKTCALAGAYSILAALLKRERSGKGCVVEMPMFETMASFVLVEHLYGKMFAGEPWQAGYTRLLNPWRRPHATKDGYIAVMAYSDVQWHRFWDEVGRPELRNAPRFTSLASRTTHIAELYRLAGECLQERTTAEWEDALTRLEIPNARVNSIENLLEDPHLRDVGFFQAFEHETEGSLLMTDAPTRFDNEAGAIRKGPPKLGQHSVEVLREAGLDDGAIDRLLSSGAAIDNRQKDRRVASGR